MLKVIMSTKLISIALSVDSTLPPSNFKVIGVLEGCETIMNDHL